MEGKNATVFPSVTLDDYKITVSATGKRAKIFLALVIKENKDMVDFGVPVERLISQNVDEKSSVLDNIPLLTERFELELKDFARDLAEHRFDCLTISRATIAMKELDGTELPRTAVLNLVFSVDATSDLNGWLFHHLEKAITLTLTQKQEAQQELASGGEDKSAKQPAKGKKAKTKATEPKKATATKMSPEAKSGAKSLDEKLKGAKAA